MHLTVTNVLSVEVVVDCGVELGSLVEGDNVFKGSDDDVVVGRGVVEVVFTGGGGIDDDDKQVKSGVSMTTNVALTYFPALLTVATFVV